MNDAREVLRAGLRAQAEALVEAEREMLQHEGMNGNGDSGGAAAAAAAATAVATGGSRL